MLFSRKTLEEREQEAQRKEQLRQEAEQQRLADELEEAREAFFESPPGQARTAFEQGDRVFQCAIEVMSQGAVTSFTLSEATQLTWDASTTLNSVCDEGWELVNGSFVFVQMGLESRANFLASGENAATHGMTMGYYLFRRAEDNRRDVGNPWEWEEEEE
jgi:hypothetical protein